MKDCYTYRGKYDRLKELHLKVTQENLQLKKELHDLYLQKNKISNEFDEYKKQHNEDTEVTQTKKVFDILAKLINNKQSCSYRYLIYDLLNFDKREYQVLSSGQVITNFLVDSFDD